MGLSEMPADILEIERFVKEQIDHWQRELDRRLQVQKGRVGDVVNDVHGVEAARGGLSAYMSVSVFIGMLKRK